jgi:hypothetical protein
MPDTKITALAAITTVAPANDLFPIVDVSDNSMAASGTTKNITVNQLLGSGGTATLATATITGDLTVDTSTLKVDSTNHRVGIGTVTPSSALHMRNASGTGIFTQYQDTGGINYVGIDNSVFRLANTTAQDLLTITQVGVFSFLDGAGGTRMTLNSTGLGVGVTPSAWSSMRAVQVLGASFVGDVTINRARVISNAYYNGSDYVYLQNNFAGMYVQNAANGTHSWSIAPSGIAGNTITGANAFVQAMTLAANGQLLLGATSTSGAVDIGMVLNKPSASGFVGNVYQFNSVDKAYTYIASGASAYRIDTVAGYTVNVVSSTNGVYLANGGTSWLALSDERFKDIIEPISNAVAKVGSLRSVIGKFKSEAEGTRRSFLIAQDVQAVLPEAVDATKPDQLGVSYSDVIPLLVAAIKELTARVQTLEAR